MADLSFAPVAGRVAPQPGTSIADMLNLAAGIQQYKQAQEMNPLTLEAQRLAVQQAQTVNPLLARQQEAATALAEKTLKPKISQAEAQAQTAQTESEKATFSLQGAKREAALRAAGAYASDKRIISGKPQDALAALAEMQESMEKSGLTRQEALYQVTPWVALMHSNPSMLATSLENAVRQGAGAAGQLPLQTPQLVTGPGGQQQLFTSGRAQLEQPAYPERGVPTRTEPGRAAPSNLPYAPRPLGQAEVFPLTFTEQEDTKAGTTHRTNLVNQQVKVPQSKFNLDEVIKVSDQLEKEKWFTSGVLGGITRKVSTALGDTTYTQLAKDLANVAISSKAAMGESLNNVDGQQLIRMANGDETYPPSVLKNIAERTKGDLTNIDLQATAAQKFAQKYGDNNMKAFQQAWTRNGDSKLFQGINILNTVQNPQERTKRLKELIGTNPAEIKKFDDMYNNIMQMVNNGELPK